MPDLSAPLRLTWDLPADPHRAAAHWKSLLRSRVLFVELALTPATLCGLAGVAGEACALGGPRVTLLASAAVAGEALAHLPEPCPRKPELLLLPPHRSDSPPEIVAACSSLTLAVWSTAEGLEEFTAALRAAREAGGGTVAVLNPPAPAPALTAAQRRRAAKGWAREGGADVTLRVHDLFLARELGLEPFREYAGCQAGAGLAHLDSEGKVYACRTLPVVLGDLERQELTEIWQGQARLDLRTRLAAPPADCGACALAQCCLGGCRGLLAAEATVADLRGRDPSCPGPVGRATGEGAAA